MFALMFLPLETLIGLLGGAGGAGGAGDLLALLVLLMPGAGVVLFVAVLFESFSERKSPLFSKHGSPSALISAAN
jgi:hypothetical protein